MSVTKNKFSTNYVPCAIAETSTRPTVCTDSYTGRFGVFPKLIELLGC